MVEFSLAFIPFFLIIVGLLEFGRAMWTYNTMSHVARQVGRYLMVRGSERPTTAADILAVAEKHAVGIESSKLTVTVEWDDANNPDTAATTDPSAVRRGQLVEVRVAYPFQFAVGVLFGPNLNTLTLASTTRMVVAN